MSLAPTPQLLAHRFFFALKPDEVTARRTFAFAEEALGAKGLLRPDHHHVTMSLTDDFPVVPEGLVEKLQRAGETVRAAPFELRLEKLVGSHGSVALRPEHVVPALQDLQKRIAAAMKVQGIAMRHGWQFSPHETLTYRKGTPFTRRVEGFAWPVSRFVLVHSFVGLHRHETIGSWPLVAPEEMQPWLL